MTTKPNPAGETWVVTVRTAFAASIATVFPATLGLTVCAATARHTATGRSHRQSVWICSPSQPDPPSPEAASRDLAVA